VTISALAKTQPRAQM